jgi:membrane fusion protein (multidrug efflux system)
MAVLLAAATSLAALSCKKEQGAAQPDPPMVQVAELTTTQVPVSTEMIGQLDSPRNVEVRARVEAFVEEVPFLEGREVQQGELLFLLDKKPFQERLAEAKGILAEATAALTKYEKDVARLQPLAQKRAIPQQDLDNALASVDVGRASVVSAEARVESATLDLGYCEVRAPVTGLIGAMMVNVGELVGKNEPTLLATISTLDPIWFYCAIAEVQYLRAESGFAATGATSVTCLARCCSPMARSIPPGASSCSLIARWTPEPPRCACGPSSRIPERTCDRACLHGFGWTLARALTAS